MDWINGLINTPSSLQTIVIISAIVSSGLALGKFKIRGISLGIACVFFTGILAGNLGLSVSPDVLGFAETFGLVLFVYTLGLYVGPTFFGALRHEGVAFNLWSAGIILGGTLLSLLAVPLFGIPLPTMIGLLCGATTNTPALGAAQQALDHLHLSSGTVALATAVTYPLGVQGVILVIMFLRRFLVKPDDLLPRPKHDEEHTAVEQFKTTNPAINGKTISQVALSSHVRFVISRIWRGGQVIVPTSDTILQDLDNLLVICHKEDVIGLEILFGEHVQKDWNIAQIDWNHIDSNVESRIIVLTQPALNGKLLGQLRMRETYGVNVSRVIRGDVKLLATNDLRLRYGDRLTIVGAPKAVDNAEKFLGNSVKTLNEPNVGNIFFGLMLGLAIGTIPIPLPGMDLPVRLGVAGGPLLMGILMGAWAPRLHLISYTTRSASLMLRKVGLSIYLGCLGLDAGKDFFSTVIRPEGLLWIGVGFLITVIPILIMGIIALYRKAFDFGTLCGVICGAMANPMALAYTNDTVDGDASSISYATVYPIGMFARVVIAQILIMFFCR